jgi:hypothetical protein
MRTYVIHGILKLRVELRQVEWTFLHGIRFPAEKRFSMWEKLGIPTIQQTPKSKPSTKANGACSSAGGGKVLILVIIRLIDWLP